MKEWKIVRSKSDAHPEFGFPMGVILCKSHQEADEYIKDSEFTDCFVSEYNGEFDENKTTNQLG